MDERLADAPGLREEARSLYPCAVFMSRQVVPPLGGLMTARNAAVTVANQLSEDRHNEPLLRAAMKAAGEARVRIVELKSAVGAIVAYPFAHAREDTTLYAYAFPEGQPTENAFSAALETADTAGERLMELYGRLLGRLALTVEAVEHALGLEPTHAPRGTGDRLSPFAVRMDRSTQDTVA